MRQFLPNCAIAVAVLAAYSNSFSGPFVFDDQLSIPGNPTIHHGWATLDAWFPPAGARTVSGRPLLNFSFAVNYALGGLDVRGYHVVNLAVHLLAALTLFGIAWRTLAKTTVGRQLVAARSLGFAIALLWALHPLQTESVTYTVQRAESLMGLFFLLTLYCFLRGGRGWLVLSAIFCLLGMATKEVVAVAPLVVLLYDRTFVAGSVAAAWAARRRYYLMLAATWVPLAHFVLSTGGRGDTAGLGMGVGAALTYARVQFGAILHYLRLAIWPGPLVFDYGTDWAHSGAGWGWAAAAIGVLVLLTLLGVRRRMAAGFLGMGFFLILAPSSSVIPIGTEAMAEHRMYLPLAAVVALAVVGVYAGLRKLSAPAAPTAGWALLAVAAIALGSATFARNAAYRSELALWRDTVAQRPDNFTARNNLALALDAAGDAKAAETQFAAALRLEPDDAKVRNSYGRLLMRAGRVAEAQDQFRSAERIDPANAESHNDLGVTLAMAGRLDRALEEFERALQLKPDYAEARSNRTRALRQLGRDPSGR